MREVSDCLYLLLLLFVLSVTAAEPGYYSLISDSKGLYLANVFLNGTTKRIGTQVVNNSFSPSQGLSALDSSKGILYTILADTRISGNRPFLFSISLSSGSVLGEPFPLPFTDGNVIGVGQVISLLPSTGEVIVGASSADNGYANFYLINSTTGSSRIFASINASVASIAPDTDYAAHLNGFLYVDTYGPDDNRLILRVDVETGAAIVYPNDLSFRISSFSIDGETLVGLGSLGDTEKIIIARFFPSNGTIVSIGSVPQYLYTIGNLNARGENTDVLAWIGLQDTEYPCYIILSSLSDGAKNLSQAIICESFEKCPFWSFDYDTGERISEETTSSQGANMVIDKEVYFNITSPGWSIPLFSVPFTSDNASSPFMNGWTAFQLTQETFYNVSIVWENIDDTIFISAIGYQNATGENPLFCTLDPPNCWQVYHNGVRKNGTGIEEMNLLPNDNVTWNYERY